MMHHVLIVTVVGLKILNDVQTCSRCGGRGTVQQQQSSPFGTFVTETTCPDCNGTGKVVKEKCPHCHGRGYETKNNSDSTIRYTSWY